MGALTLGNYAKNQYWRANTPRAGARASRKFARSQGGPLQDAVQVIAYRDQDANSAVLRTATDEPALGAFFNNELQAVGNGDGTITVINNAKTGTDNPDGYPEIVSLAFGLFVDQGLSPLGADEPSTVNALNAIFQHTGGGDGVAPVITSSTAITVSDGDQVNYILEATGGVGYEWDSLPAGLVVTATNPRRLFGEITGGPGTYSVTMKAINYYGSDTETLTITVTSSYANTKSVNFENQDYLGANAALLDGALGRAGNGSGSGDAWTIHTWFKGGTASQNSQTIFYYGSADVANAGHLFVWFRGGPDSIRFQYGTNNNRLRWDGPTGLFPAGTWKNLIIVYDGGTTGVASGSVNDYYSRFTIYVDGVDVTASGTWSNQNSGYSGSVSGQNLRVGRYTAGNYLRNSCRVDELAVWGSDQSANIAAIYNSGTPHDLQLLTTAPDHWWRMGDGDTYPNIQDVVGTATFVMYNQTAADIVNDVP